MGAGRACLFCVLEDVRGGRALQATAHRRRSRPNGSVINDEGLLLRSAFIAAAPLHLRKRARVTLEISSPETAQWFHIVDQLSGWSQFNHRQYRRRLATDAGFPADDEAALHAHAELRHRLGYGVLEARLLRAAGPWSRRSPVAGGRRPAGAQRTSRSSAG